VKATIQEIAVKTMVKQAAAIPCSASQDATVGAGTVVGLPGVMT
jgi:hypothetical protein